MTNREVKRLFEEWGSVKEVRECRGKPLYFSPPPPHAPPRQ
jgi:hypothetical protein